jgi:hypothetical protein
MCLGVKPGCGVHSLLGGRHLPARGRVRGQDYYLEGCHACDALADEHGRPVLLPRRVTEYELRQAVGALRLTMWSDDVDIARAKAETEEVVRCIDAYVTDRGGVF